MSQPDQYARNSIRLFRTLILVVLLVGGSTVSSTFAANGSVSYAYDPLGRVITVFYDTGVCLRYSYDANGNRLSQTILVSGTGSTGVWGCFAWGQAHWGP